MIYDTQQRIRNFKLYNDADVEKIIQIYYKNGKQTNADMGRMTSLLKPVLEQIDILDYLIMIRYQRMYDKNRVRSPSLYPKHINWCWVDVLLANGILCDKKWIVGLALFVEL